MISYRTADLFERMKATKREKISLIVALCNYENQDFAFWWSLNEGGHNVSLASEENFIYNVWLNAAQINGLPRSWEFRWSDEKFDENLKYFTSPTTEAVKNKKMRIFGQTAQDLYTAMKHAAPYFIGNAEHYFNDSGTCFMIIEMFRPKFHSGDFVKFKNEDGTWTSGMVVGVSGTDGIYYITHNGIETSVPEKELFPSNTIGASMISHRRADLLQRHQMIENERQQLEESKKPESLQKYPLDTIEEQLDVNAAIKDTVQEFLEKIENYWETYGGDEPQLLQSGNSPGFWNHTDGGYQGESIASLDNFVSSGGYPSNKGFRKKVDEHEVFAYKDALKSFIDGYKSELAAINIDPNKPKDLEKINYHDLYEAGHGNLAESLSEIESETMHDYQYAFFCRIFYYNPNNRNKEKKNGLPEIQFRCGVEGGMDEDAVFKRFTFRSLYELKENLKLCLNQSLKVLQ